MLFPILGVAVAKTPEEQWQSMLDNMPEKTGKSLEQWYGLLKSAELEKHGEIMQLLKGEHELTHGFANSIAIMYRNQMDGAPPSADDLVATQYSGGKAALRPIYDALLQGIQEFGDDVVVSPKKAYVSLRRKKQFGIIQPSTQTRVDVGINSKSLTTQGALEESGSFNSMVNHRVRLSNLADVSDQLFEWLKVAFDEAA
jgi:hypothetical protein